MSWSEPVAVLVRGARRLPAALLLLAACSAPPQPFAHVPGEGTAPNAMLQVSESGGIVVLTVSGVSDARGRAMAGRMAEALHRHEIPAATGGGNVRSLFLQGWASTMPAGEGAVRVFVEWDLFDPDGTLIGSRLVHRDAGRARWEAGEEALFDELSREAAAEFAALVQHPAPADAASALYLPLFVAPVTGAPGDGATALRGAMAESLGRRSFRLTPAPGPQALIVAGGVRMGPVHGGAQDVEIVWSVRHPDGTELGNLVQRNAVPAGSLDGAWGNTAGAIADSAVDGLNDLLVRLSADVLPARDAGAIPRGRTGP